MLGAPCLHTLGIGMDYCDLDTSAQATLEHVLGYLNFSSGTSDPHVLAAINEIYTWLDGRTQQTDGAAWSAPSAHPTDKSDGPTYRQAIDLLEESLRRLSQANPAFADTDQAHSVLRLVRDQIIPGYRIFHRDLLFHQTDDNLFGPFMLGRIFEVTLQQSKPWSESEPIVDKVISSLNTFLGHRPVPSLESQKIEPRPREWVCPIPVYVKDAGVCMGPYRELLESALQRLQETDSELLRAAFLDPEAIEELTVDPRSYDFDHPANRRPNYHFGEWDPQHIDNKGQYRRFVIREVNLLALMARVNERGLDGPPREELLIEAGAVLAGTMLMASGVSGSGPGSHDSNATLMTLITNIAAYRDRFYEQMMDQLDGALRDRLQEEAGRLRQPFGGARQHLNSHLSRQRAAQLEHVKLAKVFARMGYVEAAQRQVDEVRVASARTLCRIDCAITAGHQAIRGQDYATSLEQVDCIVDLLHRGIDCGAIVDPWNIIGFDANFSLFPALENSIRDHRIDELITTMDRVFDLFARLWSAAAAKDEQELATSVDTRFSETANWWHRFAAHEVSSVDATSALLEYEAAKQVAESLNKWHRGGAATGDVRFWAPYVENFDSPKAYALVIETLLGDRDLVSTMSLLIHWLSQSPRVSLHAPQSSFHQIAERWIRSVVRAVAPGPQGKHELPIEQSWKLLKRFFELLEPNAEDHWEPLRYELARGPAEESDRESEEDDDANDLFRAAYENVVFQDSTNDGVDGFVFDTGHQTNEELERESDRIVERLAFQNGLAKLWTTTSVAIGTTGDALSEHVPADSLKEWYRTAHRNRRTLCELLREVGRESIPRPTGQHESMVDYDRHRLIKETLIEQIIATIVEMSQAERFLLAAVEALSGEPLSCDDDSNDDEMVDEMGDELRQASRLLAATLKRDREAAADICDGLLEELPNRELLYVPLAKSGSGIAIATVRMRQRIIENLLVALPRLGLLAHTLDLIDTAREMEFNMPAGRGAVTQFDELFDVGFRELVQCLVRSTKTVKRDDGADSRLIGWLEQLTESVLRSWLEHSRTLRLSVLERVRNNEAWDDLVEFIKEFGNDLFTQRFFGLGNTRAILHCGVDNWLAQIEESGIEPPFRMMEELDRSVPRTKAVDYVTLILESVVENYPEYRDYNSTTTQSDQGEMFYMLLDFLRLKSAYDRVAWNLTPVVIAHEVLVRRGRSEAAQLWRRALSERVGGEADRYMERLAELQSQYAMRMASVADRLGERFLRPMTIDRMRALVQPAIEQRSQPEPRHAFEILEEETALLMREPAGSGLDVPQWLAALEDEIERLKPWSPVHGDSIDDELYMVPYELDLDEIQRQLDEL